MNKHVKECEVVVCETDKSGRLAVVSRELYDLMGDEHVKDNKIVDWADVESAQRLIKGHLRCLNNIFQPGSESQSEDRVRKAKELKSTVIPVLSLLMKDHKQTGADRVPASRPVCGASSSIKGELSEWVSSVLDSVCKSEDTDEAISGEEMRAHIDDLVEKMKNLPEEESVFVGSLDAKALFPSLKIKESAKLVARRIQDAEVKFENVGYKWASMYFALSMEFTDVVRQDIQSIVPRKRAKRGSDPTVRTVSA